MTVYVETFYHMLVSCLWCYFGSTGGNGSGDEWKHTE